jgi:hypothetical protein
MPSRTSRRLWVAVAAISSAAVGCSSDQRPTAPLPQNQSAALAVAADFSRMGDSVVAQHGDSDAANRYYGAAALLRRVPAFDTVTIDIDSVPMSFDAVALAVVDTDSTGICPMPPMDDDRDAQFECPWGAPRSTRTLFAWQPGHPPHIIQLVASADSSGIGLPGRWRWIMGGSDTTTTDSASMATFVLPARLKYFSGDGSGIWWGSDGSQMSSATPNGQPCPVDTAASDSTSTDSASADRGGYGGMRDGHGWGGFHMSTASCQMADFTFQFAGTVRVPPVIWWHDNTASGTHTLSLDASKVPGAYVTVGFAASSGSH